MSKRKNNNALVNSFKNPLRWVLLALPLLALAASLPEGTRPWIVGGPSTHINWAAGTVTVNTSAPVDSRQNASTARRAAVVQAQAAALKAVMSTHVDDTIDVGQHEALSTRARGIVRGGRITQEGLRGKRYRITYEVPLAGVQGLAWQALTVYWRPTHTRSAPPKKSVSADPQSPQVLIDAREASLEPALLPHIRTIGKSGEKVDAFGPDTLNPQAVESHLPIRYLTLSASGSLGRLQGSSKSFLLSGNILYSLLQNKPPKRRRRKRVILKAKTDKEGKQPVNLLLTPEGAQKAQSGDAQKALEQGQVYVVVAADVGAVEGRLLHR